MKHLLFIALALGLISCGYIGPDRFEKKQKDPKDDPERTAPPPSTQPPPAKPKPGPKKPPAGDAFSFNKQNLEASQLCGDAIVPRSDDPMPGTDLDLEEIKQALEGEGLKGLVHGAVHRYGYYVLNYGPTLKSVQFNLVPANRAVGQAFAALNRHDGVLIKGELITNHSAVQHIRVASIEVVEPYTSPVTGTHDYTLDLDKLLAGDRRQLFVKVHANIADGKALVVGIRDVVLPVHVNEQHRDLTKDLFRNDKILLDVAIMRSAHPDRPAHLMTDPEVGSAVKVVDHMVNCHKKEIVLEGTAVKFFKSPQISLDVYAIKQVDANGLERNFTLFPDADNNDDFFDLFMKLSERAKLAWDEHADLATHGRNNMHNKRLIVKANGWMNIVSKNQANPQIMLKSVDDISFAVAAD